jgi:ketosteroid isomerase-like protein
MANDLDNEFAEFLKTRQVVAQAYVNGDGAPLAGISASTDPATFFGPGGGIDQGAAKVLEVNLEGAARFRPGGQSRLEILHAQASGELAYWVGIQHASVKMGADKHGSDMTLRVTEIFRREQGTWTLVHRHADASSERGAHG